MKLGGNLRNAFELSFRLTPIIDNVQNIDFTFIIFICLNSTSFSCHSYNTVTIYILRLTYSRICPTGAYGGLSSWIFFKESTLQTAQFRFFHI